MVNISDGVPNTVGAFTAFIGARAVSRARNVAVVVALVTAMAGPAACADNTKSPEAVQRILRMAAQIAAVDDDTRFPDPFSEVCARLAVPDAEINAFRVLAFSALVRQSKVHPGAEAPEPCGQTLISAQWNYASKEAVNANHALPATSKTTWAPCAIATG